MWQPAGAAERCYAIDVLRSLALFGVLMVNLLTAFRIPLLEHAAECIISALWLCDFTERYSTRIRRRRSRWENGAMDARLVRGKRSSP